MLHALRQAGFLIIVAYCGYTLMSLLWFVREAAYALQFVMLAVLAYGIIRIRELFRVGFVVRRTEYVLLVLLFLSAFSLALQKTFLTPFSDLDEIEALDYTVRLWVNGVVWLLIGAAVAQYEGGVSRKMAIVVTALILAPVAAALNDERLTVNYSALVQGTVLEEYGLSHLHIAEFIVLLFYAAYAFGRGIRWVILGCALFALFAAGGRSSFYLGTASVIGYELIHARRASRGLLIAGGVLVVIALFSWLAVELELFDPESRTVRAMLFLDGVENDNSYVERKLVLTEGFTNLPQQLLYGDPTLIARQFGHIGSYLHNLLSAWQFFGLPVFLMFVFALVLAVRRMISVVRNQPAPIETFGALVLIYTIANVALSKFVGFYFLWFSIGFWMTRRAGELRRPSRGGRAKSGTVLGHAKRRGRKRGRRGLIGGFGGSP